MIDYESSKMRKLHIDHSLMAQKWVFMTVDRGDIKGRISNDFQISVYSRPKYYRKCIYGFSNTTVSVEEHWKHNVLRLVVYPTVATIMISIRFQPLQRQINLAAAELKLSGAFLNLEFNIQKLISVTTASHNPDYW